MAKNNNVNFSPGKPRAKNITGSQYDKILYRKYNFWI